MGDSVNNLIDNLGALLWRLLELPTYALLVGTVVLVLLLNLIIRKWLKKVKPGTTRWINIVGGALLLVFIIDKKFQLLRSELTAMQERMNELRMVESEGVVGSVYNVSRLLNQFPDVKIYQRSIDQVAEIIVMTSEEPKAVAYIAIIDLNFPNLEINLTPEKKEKYLTSTFAIESGSYIAVNGEAGETMDLNAPLGHFVGNWVDDGHAVMMEDNSDHPFISFTKYNVASYSEASIVDTVLTEDKYNVIWGRWDILLDGKVLEHENDQQYARTIIGINESGDQLFLMVVDGKRADYSLGFKYSECAQILLELGAFNVMACDQGGSSCMYIEQLGGIVNRPADSDGYERPVYSHFGVSW